VTGPGGVGKTRLAVELAGRMRAAGWRAERIADGAEAGAIGALRAVTRGRALLIVDYAEARTGLEPMLAALVGEQGSDVWVLFLARAGGDWLDQLGVADPGVWDLVQDARAAQIVLPAAVAPGLSDADVIALAVRSFARELGVADRTVEVYGGTGRRRVLDLHAAALVALLDGAAAGVVRVDIGTVLEELLRHEQHFWYETARASGLRDGPGGATTQALRQAVAVGCLLGAASQQEAQALPGRVPGMSPSVKIAAWLRTLYPPGPDGDEWIGAVQPDRLAELHAVRELTAAPEFARACLTGLDALQALRAVTLLARATSDHPEAEALLGQALPGTASLITGMPVAAQELTAIYNAIPYPTVILAPAAAAIAQRIIRLLPADTDSATRAYWLDHLGIRFSALGRPAEALATTEEAVTIWRELAAANPDRYRPDLAASLTNLGACLWDLGRPAEALPVTEEAVAIRRELAAANPDRYRPDLARSLTNLAEILEALGRKAESGLIRQEAGEVRLH
jgi:tetratricopeptide (TPR) repeat protein